MTTEMKDPVCGMMTTDDSRFRYVYAGRTYLFCSANCLAKFRAFPEDYPGKAQSSQSTQPAPERGGRIYTCPMHPEIRQPAPGRCTKCGMVLEPEAANELVPGTRGMVMNWQAPFYDWGCRVIGLGRNFRAETLRYAMLKPGERVLDVGCGTGVLTRLAAEAVGPSGHVVGIDPSPGMIGVARVNATQISSRAEFKLAAIERLPFEDASFDVVLSSCMLHHLPAELKHEGLREVRRMLKPGGRFVAVDIDRPANPLWWLVIWPLLMMQMTAINLRGEIPDYLRGAGFERIQVKGRWAGWLSFWVATKPGRPEGDRNPI